MINQDFKSSLDLVKAFPDEQTCIEHLETVRWRGNVVSPFDSLSKVYVCKGNKYKCKNTGKYFNVKTDTMFDNTKIELQKWFLAIWIVTSQNKEISSLQLGRDLDITQKSAWFLLQRIRKCFGTESNNKLDNQIEGDETYGGGMNKNHNVKKAIASQVRNTKEKTLVGGLVELNEEFNTDVVDDLGSDTLTHEVSVNLKESASLYTDEWLGYKGGSRIYDRSKLKYNHGQFLNGRIQTNTIEEF